MASHALPHLARVMALDELAQVVHTTSEDNFLTLAQTLDQAREHRVFFTGQGRSGLVAHMAGMRFMHMGFRTYVVGEATAPSIRNGDVLVIVSGSGRTPVSLSFAEIARDQGAAVLLVTHQEASPLRSLADASVVLPCEHSRQFGGTLFEQSALILLDSLVYQLTRADPASHERMWHNHTNLQ